MRGYLYEVQGYYSQGWECVFAATTKEEARQILADYRENERGTAFRMKWVRQ